MFRIQPLFSNKSLICRTIAFQTQVTARPKKRGAFFSRESIRNRIGGINLVGDIGHPVSTHFVFLDGSFFATWTTIAWRLYWLFWGANLGLFLIIFILFHIPIQMTNISFELYKLKRCCAWDSNPWLQDDRRWRFH